MSKPTTAELDRLEAAMTGWIKLVKRPAYWEHFTRQAGVNIDRPTAAILQVLTLDHCQFQSLVNQLAVEAPAVSRKVHSLEESGLINRQQTNDRRVHQLSLSNEGQKIADRLAKTKRQMLSTVIDSWTDEDRTNFINLLEKFVADMSKQFHEQTKMKENM